MLEIVNREGQETSHASRHLGSLRGGPYLSGGESASVSAVGESLQVGAFPRDCLARRPYVGAD